MTEFYTIIESPIGKIALTSNGSALTSLRTEKNTGFKNSAKFVRDDNAKPFKEAEKQLNEYFKGKREKFDLPLAQQGTEFQRKVWSALRKIPFGETRTYKDIAESLNNPKAVRAVGSANGQNPIAIIVPCHRVIGSNGKLTGFNGGVEVKQWLLEKESAA